jgi:predicted HD phosphohydrolase
MVSSFQRISVLFDEFGELDYIGEPVSIVNHCLQAAFIASKNTSDSEIILASLLHDIGHVVGLEAFVPFRMGGCGIVEHESIGSDFLIKLGFSERVSELVKAHVSAKRYLCFKNPEYFRSLSDASITTLKYQGGPMDESDALKFEKNSDFQNFLLMRTFDEAAKVPNMKVESLHFYHDLFPKSLEYSYILSQVQLDSYRANSFLKIQNFLKFENISINVIKSWCDEIRNWEYSNDDENINNNENKNKYLLHFELNKIENKRIICRIENFVNFHQQMNYFAKKQVLNIISQLFNEPAVLFKEKINFKMPGGAGFAIHQDTPLQLI